MRVEYLNTAVSMWSWAPRWVEGAVWSEVRLREVEKDTMVVNGVSASLGDGTHTLGQTALYMMPQRNISDDQDCNQ